jgi:hypothetical protein
MISLAISLAFGIFMLNNGEVSWFGCENFFCELMTPPLFYAFKILGSFTLKFHLHFISIFIMTFQILLMFPFFDLQKFNDEEWADMPIYNLVEIVHNIWLQQSGSNSGTCLYIAMFNNYIHAFKPFTLYRQYL